MRLYDYHYYRIPFMHAAAFWSYVGTSIGGSKLSESVGRNEAIMVL